MPRATAKALEWGAILAILALAIYLRMGNPGIVEFKRDEANLSLLALDFANGGDVPLLGIGSSVGVPNAPFNVYVLAIPYFFTSNPQIATQFIGLLNVFAVALTYWMGRRYGGVFAGLTAALLLAANPWAVIFSRKIWAQNMLPVFILLTIGSGLLGFVDRKRWAKVLHFPLLAITGQIHYGAFVIVPVSLYLLLRDRRRDLRYVVIGFVLAFLVTLPYVIGMVRAGWDDPQRVIAAVSAGDDAAEDRPLISPQAVDGARVLFEGAETHSLAGPEAFDDYLETVPEVGSVLSIFSVMLVISCGWLLFRIVKRSDARTPVDIVLLTWLVFPIVAYSVDWTTFFIHYLIPALPAGFLIIGFCIRDFAEFLAKRNAAAPSFRGFAYAGVVGIAILQAILFVRLLNFLDTHHTPDGFGTPLHYVLDVRAAIFANDAPVIGRLDGMAIGISDDVTVWAALLYDADARFETEGTTVYPAETSTLLSYCDEMQQPQAIFRSRPDDLCYALTTRPAGRRTAMLEPVEASFANGVKIEGYRWLSNCLSVWWRITEETQADYHFAVKFFDEQAREIQGADGLSWFGRYWRPGDTVKREFCINPEDAVLAEQVHLGMYTFDGTSFYNVGIPGSESDVLIFDL